MVNLNLFEEGYCARDALCIIGFKVHPADNRRKFILASQSADMIKRIGEACVATTEYDYDSVGRQGEQGLIVGDVVGLRAGFVFEKSRRIGFVWNEARDFSGGVEPR